jgi:PLP dependent protein
MEEQPITVSGNIERVRSQLVAAHGAAPGSAAARVPRLVAVSKYKPLELLRDAYANAGQRAFGENYVQELLDKAPAMPDDTQWHFIGHLQSNKAARLVAGVPHNLLVETVDTAKLAGQLEKAVAKVRPERPLPVFVQVNTSGEAAKSGVAPGAAALELAALVVRKCPHLRFRGLMTIGVAGEGAEACFETLARDRAAICEALREELLAGGAEGGYGDADPASFELSMGMSADYEAAIACGSTNIRVGSAIFGARDDKSIVAAKAREAAADKQLADEEAVGAGAEAAAAGAVAAAPVGSDEPAAAEPAAGAVSTETETE